MQDDVLRRLREGKPITGTNLVTPVQANPVVKFASKQGERQKATQTKVTTPVVQKTPVKTKTPVQTKKFKTVSFPSGREYNWDGTPESETRIIEAEDRAAGHGKSADLFLSMEYPDIYKKSSPREPGGNAKVTTLLGDKFDPNQSAGRQITEIGNDINRRVTAPIAGAVQNAPDWLLQTVSGMSPGAAVLPAERRAEAAKQGLTMTAGIPGGVVQSPLTIAGGLTQFFDPNASMEETRKGGAEAIAELLLGPLLGKAGKVLKGGRAVDDVITKPEPLNPHNLNFGQMDKLSGFNKVNRANTGEPTRIPNKDDIPKLIETANKNREYNLTRQAKLANQKRARDAGDFATADRLESEIAKDKAAYKASFEPAKKTKVKAKSTLVSEPKVFKTSHGEETLVPANVRQSIYKMKVDELETFISRHADDGDPMMADAVKLAQRKLQNHPQASATKPQDLESTLKASVEAEQAKRGNLSVVQGGKPSTPVLNQAKVAEGTKIVEARAVAKTPVKAKEPWQMTREGYTHSVGASKPEIDLLSDSSAHQRSKMSDRARKEMLDQRLSEKAKARERYEAAGKDWESSVVDAVTTGKIDPAKAFDTDVYDFINDIAKKSGFKAESPFKIRQMADAQRAEYFGNLKTFLSKQSPDDVKKSLVQPEIWQKTRDQHWREEFPDVTYGSSRNSSTEAFNKAQRHISQHKMAVQNAISEGKPVPAPVLAEYPDLAKPKAQKTPVAEVARQAKAPVKGSVGQETRAVRQWLTENAERGSWERGAMSEFIPVAKEVNKANLPAKRKVDLLNWFSYNEITDVKRAKAVIEAAEKNPKFQFRQTGDYDGHGDLVSSEKRAEHISEGERVAKQNPLDSAVNADFVEQGRLARARVDQARGTVAAPPLSPTPKKMTPEKATSPVVRALHANTPTTKAQPRGSVNPRTGLNATQEAHLVKGLEDARASLPERAIHYLESDKRAPDALRGKWAPVLSEGTPEVKATRENNWRKTPATEATYGEAPVKGIVIEVPGDGKFTVYSKEQVDKLGAEIKKRTPVKDYESDSYERIAPNTMPRSAEVMYSEMVRIKADPTRKFAIMMKHDGWRVADLTNDATITGGHKSRTAAISAAENVLGGTSPLKPGYKVSTPDGEGVVRSTVGGKITVDVKGTKKGYDPSEVTLKSKKVGGGSANMFMDNDQLVAMLDRARDSGITSKDALMKKMGNLASDPQAMKVFNEWASKNGVNVAKTAVRGVRTNQNQNQGQKTPVAQVAKPTTLMGKVKDQVTGENLRSNIKALRLTSPKSMAQDFISNTVSSAVEGAVGHLDPIYDALFFRKARKTQGAASGFPIVDVGAAIKGLKNTGREVKEGFSPQSSSRYGSAGKAVLRPIFGVRGLSDAPFKAATKGGVTGQLSRINKRLSPAEVAQIAEKEADEAVFANDNKFADWWHKLPETFGQSVGLASDTIVPYPKTPSNIAGRITDYTPFGFAKALSRAVKNKGAIGIAERREINRLASRATASIPLAYLGYKLAEDGLLKPENVDVKGRWIRWSPKNPWIDTDELGPQQKMVFYTAGLKAIDDARYADGTPLKKETATKFKVQLAASLLLDSPAMRGAETLTKLKRDPVGGATKAAQGHVTPGFAKWLKDLYEHLK